MGRVGNRIQSSRRLESECQRNVELMWLTGRLAPDFTATAQTLAGRHLRERQRLIRQYLLKGTDLSFFSHDELDGIADSLNTRPCATHNWHTPLEGFAQKLAGSHKPPASIH
jgi:hypothetical protein